MPAVSPIVHARSAQVGIGERESRRYWGQQLVVRGQLHSPMGKLVMRAAHVAPIRARCFNSKRTSFHVALELEHMESVLNNLKSVPSSWLKWFPETAWSCPRHWVNMLQLRVFNTKTIGPCCTRSVRKHTR